MKGTRILSIILLVVTLISAMPISALVVFAESVEPYKDAMENIQNELGAGSIKNYQIGETLTIDDGGNVGNLEMTIFFDKANHTAKSGYYGSHLVMYVVNTRTERIGTKSDVEIIRSMLDRGYIVAVADYKNAENACGATLDYSANYVRNKLIARFHLCAVEEYRNFSFVFL